MLDNIKKKLADNDPVFGVVTSMLDYTVSEMLGYAGFDFLWIDMEHNALGTPDVLMHIIAASSGRTASFVRVPWNDPVLVKPILEMGPDAVIFPMVRTAEDARKAVAACEYPPKGARGYGPRRAIRYGMVDNMQYIGKAPELTWKILQVELAECVDNLEEIACVEGVDALMVGPYDLSGSVGKLGEIDDVKVQEEFDRIGRIAAKHNKLLCAYTGDDPEQLEKWAKRGVKVFALNSDQGYLMAAARRSLERAGKTLGRG